MRHPSDRSRMKNHLAFALGIAIVIAACHRGSTSMQREQKNYDVVQEGQASGVSSTISAPGETPPPMSNTNADTTSNFTIAPNIDTTGTTNTAVPMPPMTSAVPPPSPPQPRRISPPRQEVKPPTATDTIANTSTLPPTDTTTTAAPPPPPDQQPPDPQDQPPATQTDTRG